MPWASAGKGNPLSFRCTVCRRRHGYDGPSALGRSDHVDFLPDAPRWQSQREGRRACSPRMRMWAVRYRCRDCGHVGWSAHNELVRAWERSTGQKLAEKHETRGYR